VEIAQVEYGRRPGADFRPTLRLARLVLNWAIGAVALVVAAWIVPGAHVKDFWAALAAAALIAILNAIVPPFVAALRIPYAVALTFLLVLLTDALLLWFVGDIWDGFEIDSFWSALATAVLVAAVSLVLEMLFGTNDEQAYSLQVVDRVARRSTDRIETNVPGIVYLEIDGLAAPVLRRAMRAGSAPYLARWLAEDTHELLEWETDLSSQTGASQAGILLGSNEDIPAFRWVEKRDARLMVCSNPDDCAEIERRHSTGDGLLAHGGASRGNLLSGDADHVMLTVSRMSAEKKANPAYRTFFANGYNVTRLLVLVVWEVILEVTAAARQRRRDVLPRGHRGGIYPLLRAGVCVFVRDLSVYGVLTDMFKGRPAVYATFASYDEVAHHSGLERPDTLESLRKLDQHFGRIDRARRYAPRPYHIVVLSDHGQTQGATFKQRNGYGLDELVERSLASGDVASHSGEDENSSVVGTAISEATGGRGQRKEKPKNDVSDQDVVVLGSGNLGLVYLMEERRRLTLEEIDARHPRLLPVLREHPHIGFVVARSERGHVALGADGAHWLETGQVDGADPLAPFSSRAGQHLLRSSRFEHAPDLYVNSFFDHELDEGCAFEELISFHGGMGGEQTRPFILYPQGLPVPDEPIVGAAHVHTLLKGWRALLQGEAGPPAP
jgi:uncharacterized membrane protein YvlD (DUF360 family)